MIGRGHRLRVLADRARVDDAMVQAAKQRGFVDGAGWLTFAQLVESIGGARNAGRRRCSALTARVLVGAAARELGPGPFGAHVHEPAFARAAAELFWELKAGGLSPSDFQRAVAHFPAGRIERAKYLFRLYAEYEQRLAVLQLADGEDEVLLATESLRRRGLPPALAQAPAIDISGLYDFPPSRRQFLLELARQGQRSGVRLHLEFPGAGAAAVDGAVDPLLSELEREAERFPSLEAFKRDLIAEGRPLAVLGPHLFDDGAVPLSAAEPLPLELVRTASARHEARTLARMVADRVAAGIAPERIAVAWPDSGEEIGWILEALEELGVPARAHRGQALYATPLGRLAMDLPLIADDGFPAGRVAELLSSRYAPALAASAPQSPAEMLAEAGVRDDRLGAAGGKGAYEVRLAALARRLSARGAAARAARATELLDRCRRLIAIVARVPEEARIGSMLQQWWHALDEVGVASAAREPRVREPHGTALGRAALRAAARDQAAWEALQSMAGDLQLALRDSGAAAARIGRRAFHRWLLDASLDYGLPARGPRGGAVHVLEVRALAGRAFAHVFLAGLADGRFPGRDSPHPLFPDEDRQRVNERCERDVFRLLTGEAKRRIPRRLAADRLLFHLALSSSTGRVTVSVSGLSPSGAEQMPSPFWDELVRVTGVAPRSIPFRAVPLLDEVRTERELRERAALEAFAPAALRTEDPDPAGAELGRRVGEEPWFGAAAALARIEEERLRFFGDPERAPGPFSGDAGRDDARAALTESFRFGPGRPLSASKLDRFGECAFRGFLQHALHLSEPEEPGEEIDRRLRGTFWHRVLERLFPLLAERGLLRADPEAIPAELVDRAIAAAAAESERSGSTGHPALWRVGQERARRMVRGLLASDRRGLPFDGLDPQAAEREFGTPNAPEGWREVALPGPEGAEPVFVRGKIDRLDGGAGALGVVDYKSGAVEKGKPLADALLTTRFQLPLYLYAARAAGHQGRLDGAWVSLKNGEVVRLSEALDEAGAVDAFVERNLPAAVHALVAGLRAGRFPARSDDCSTCSYRRVCRITERALPEEGGNGS